MSNILYNDTSRNNSSALLIIGLQNDFCEGGNLAISNLLQIIPKINIIKKKFNLTIFIKDWHPNGHISFNKNGGKWPSHCIMNSKGAELNTGILVNSKDYVINKGTLQLFDSDSAFYNAKLKNKKTKLEKILKNHKIKILYICGAMLEHFILSTVIDAIKLNYKCVIIDDVSLCLDNKKRNKCKNYLNSIGIKFINSSFIK